MLLGAVYFTGLGAVVATLHRRGWRNAGLWAVLAVMVLITIAVWLATAQAVVFIAGAAFAVVGYSGTFLAIALLARNTPQN